MSAAFENASEKKKGLTLAALFCGLLGSLVVSSTQSTMLPAAAMEIGGEDIYSLVATLAGTVSVIAMPLYGYLSARRPAIKPRLFSLSMLLTAAVIFLRAIAGNMWMIIIPGVLYGLSSAAIYVVGFSLIRDIYDNQKAAYYLGFVAAVQSVGQIIGPTLGGMIIDSLSWRYLNHCIWPVMLLAGILSLLGVQGRPEAAAASGKESVFDFWGAISLTLFLGSLTLALSIGTSFAPFGSAVSNCLLALSALALVSLAFSVKKKKDKAFLPLGVLKDRNTLCLALANLFTNLHTMAAFFFLPMFAMYVLNATAVQAGLITSLHAAVGVFMGPVWGKIIGKAQTARPVLLLGTTLRIGITAAFVFLLNKDCPLFLIYLLMFIGGFYNSQTGATFAAAPQIMLKEENRVQGNSIIQMAQNIGSTLAVAFYTLLIGIQGVEAGIHTAMLAALVFSVLALAAGLLLRDSN